MNIKNTLFTLGLIAVALVAGFSISKSIEKTDASTINLGPILQVATTTASQAITSSARIIATTTTLSDPTNSYTRLYATICNPNANPVFISMNGDKPASIANVQAIIAAAAGYNACFEITDRNPYNGSVTASSTNQTSTTINVTQYVY